MIRYQALVEKDGSTYSVSFPDLPGCLSSGDSREAAVENAREALSLYLEEARDPKWEVPKPKARKSRRYVWVSPFVDVAIPLMIRQARLSRGLTQAQLAKRLDVTLQQVQKLETPGRSNPTVKTLAAISEALEEALEISLVA
jgi:antitoxin HicB